jgi:serine/threonine protein kinase
VAGQSGDFIRRELAALLSMRTDCIPRVYDWIVNDRVSFFVMDFYPHGTLSDVFKKPGTFTDDDSWLLLADLMRALKVAHRAGLLHLDIKPGNVMHDGDGGFLLLDFGISQASQVASGPGQTIGAGSLGYQSPEQRRLELEKLDTRTDLWAVGATAWAARTGIDLRRHPDRLILHPGAAGHSLPPLSRECLGCSSGLEEIIMGLLYDDASYRPGGAAEVLEHIKMVTGITIVDDESRVKPREHTQAELDAVIGGLMDPLWGGLCQRGDFTRYFAKFDKGDYLCRQGDASHDAFVLLAGEVAIERDGRILGNDGREGTFVGEISTLTGTLRAASVKALTTVWVCVFNAAELERLLAAHPSIGIRLVKLMAERLIQKA